MKKVFRILLWVVVAAVFIGTFVFLYLNSRTAEIKYAEVTPSISTIERTTVLTGKIEPRDEIQIKPQISGIISEINVEAGQHVSAGDVIAHIKVIPDASSLSSAQNRVTSAQIEMNDARTRYERDKVLREKKVISQQEFDDTEKAFRKASEELEAARDALSIVQSGVSKFNATESNTLVRATITGLVLDVPVKVGTSVIQTNTMNDGTTIATIADMSNLIFRGNVDETELGMLHTGMPMEITIGAVPDVHPDAVIEYISPKGTDTSGANTFEIKAAVVLDDYSRMRSGYSANAKVILDRAADVLALPEGVISFRGDSTFVFVRSDSTEFVERAITTGLSDGIMIEVKDGIDSTAVVRGAQLK